MYNHFNHIISIKVKVFYAFILLLLIAVDIYSNKYNQLDFKTLTVKNYSIENGMSDNTIKVIFQDYLGYLWIGTKDGLNRFDGYDFKVFRHSIIDTSSISSNIIECIQQDSKNNIWIGTKGGGLNKWNYKEKKFVKYNSKTMGLPEDNIYAIKIIDYDDIWLKSDNYLIHLNPVTNKISAYGLFNNLYNYRGSSKTNIFMPDKSQIWIGTDEGFARFLIKETLYSRLQVDDNKDLLSTQIGAVTSIKKLNDKKYLLGSSEGLFSFDYIPGKKHSLTSYTFNKEGSNDVSSILNYSDTITIVGSSDGIFIAKHNNRFENVEFCAPLSCVRKGSNLFKSSITCLFKDKSGIVWAGTKFNGIVKIDVTPKRFRSISIKNQENKNINNYNIKSIISENNGNLWLGTANNGILLLDTKTKKTTPISINKNKEKLNSYEVLSMCEIKDNIWIGTNNGIFILNKKNKKVKEFNYVKNKEMYYLLKDNLINDIVFDSVGDIWFATGFGLYRYNGNFIKSFFADSGIKSNNIVSDVINCLYLDSKGILWIASNNGVNYIDTKSPNSKIKLLKDNSNTSLINNKPVLSISEIDENIYFGTNHGVTKYDSKSKEIVIYSKNQGLNGLCCALIADNKGDLWVGTNRGISQIKKNDFISNYSVEDGLIGYSINNNSVAKSKNGELYFGGQTGISSVNPDSIIINSYNPRIEIVAINVFKSGRLVRSFDPKSEKINLIYSKEMSLQIKVTALDFTKPKRNHYRYYLKGLNNKWEIVNNTNKININKLPLGSFSIYIKGSNNDAIWTETPIVLKVDVSSPIWLSKYAYAFYLLAFFIFIQLVINYRIKNYKTKLKKLEENTINKKLVESQKEELALANRHLTDSIYYAKRIQDSILPNKEYMNSLFPFIYVYFNPKDIVSGDFYFVKEVDDKIWVATIDCTGHGVSGAFMSIIGHNMLSNILELIKNPTPAVVLKQLNAKVHSIFNDKKNKEIWDGVKDGMDMSLCVIDKETKTMIFAGALNPLYLIRNMELKIFKGDRYSICPQTDINTDFTDNYISLKEDDFIFIFSDGYADQFGGDKGKKFKYNKFKNLLLNIYDKPSKEQIDTLNYIFLDWKKELDQIDDVMIMGFKPV